MTSDSTKKPLDKGGRRRARRHTWLRALVRGVAGMVGVGAVMAVVLYADGRTAMGRAPAGARLARMMASPQWTDGKFRNPRPLNDEVMGAFAELAGASEHVSPSVPIPVATVDPGLFNTPPDPALRLTWLGHSTVLLEIEGTTLLTDPVWGLRASPWSWLGPKRWYDSPLALEDLPPLDAVVISHDHYDHLDHPTIVALRDREVPFIVPLGVGARLESWGVSEERIVELDWWDGYLLGGLEIVMTPARHASGRKVFDRDRTLWAGYAFLGEKHRVFFSGDTGMFPGFEEIASRLGPFGVTMIEVGTYAQSWADWHLGPEQALKAHAILGGEVFLPIHWAMFNLSTHGWTEPMERVLAASGETGGKILTLRPGGSWVWGQPVESRRWWPILPWREAEEYPIVSSLIGGG